MTTRGASASAVGNNPTKDSFSDGLDLTRFGAPRYTSDVPSRGPFPNNLSHVLRQHRPGRARRHWLLQPRNFARHDPAGFCPRSLAKAPTPPVLDPGGSGQLIAYNGDPAANGFGLYRDAANFVARIGAFEQILGPATDNAWHHLAYVQSLGTTSYYYDGNLVKSTTKDPLPSTATGASGSAAIPTAP